MYGSESTLSFSPNVPRCQKTHNNSSKTICMTTCKCEWSQQFSLTLTLNLAVRGYCRGTGMELNSLSSQLRYTISTDTHAPLMGSRHTICPESAFFCTHTYSSPPSHSQIPPSIQALAQIANLTLMPCSALALSEPRLVLLPCSLHIFRHSPYLTDGPRFDSCTPYLTLSFCLSVSVPSSFLPIDVWAGAGRAPQVQHVALSLWRREQFSSYSCQIQTKLHWWGCRKFP